MTLRRYSGVGDDVDPLVVGDRHEVVLDEVAAGAEHRVAVGLERGVEVGRLVGLDPVDDGRLVGVRVDLAGGRGAGRPLLVEPLPAELEDGVGVEAVERAQADQRVVPLAADRPVVGARRRACPRASDAYSSTAILADSLARSRRRCSAGRQDADAGGDDLVEEGRQLGRGLDLDLLPAPDLRDGRPGLRFLEVGRRSPRAGRRWRRAARRAARGRARTAGTGRRRRGRGRTSGAPRYAGSSASKIARRTLWSSSSRSKRASAESAAGSSASTAARWSRSAASSARTASRLPSPSRSSSWWSPSEVREDRVVADEAHEARSRRGRRSSSSSGPGVGRRQRGAGAARRVVGRSLGGTSGAPAIGAGVGVVGR